MARAAYEDAAAWAERARHAQRAGRRRRGRARRAARQRGATPARRAGGAGARPPGGAAELAGDATPRCSPRPPRPGCCRSPASGSSSARAADPELVRVLTTAIAAAARRRRRSPGVAAQHARVGARPERRDRAPGGSSATRRWRSPAATATPGWSPRRCTPGGWRCGVGTASPSGCRRPRRHRATPADAGDVHLELTAMLVAMQRPAGERPGRRAAGDARAGSGTRSSTLHSPVYDVYSEFLESCRLLTVGDYDEAERIADEALVAGLSAHGTSTEMAHAGQMFCLAWDHGQLADVVDFVEVDRGSQPTSSRSGRSPWAARSPPPAAWMTPASRSRSW